MAVLMGMAVLLGVVAGTVADVPREAHAVLERSAQAASTLTWSKHPTGIYGIPRNIHFIDKNEGWMGGSSGSLFHSTTEG